MTTLNLLVSTLFVILFLPSCDRNNNHPEIADQVFYLDENSETGTLVGKIEANDLGELQALSFEIVEGNTDNAFTLEKKTGNLLVNNRSVLDFEKIQIIDLQVLVSDNHPNDPLESTAIISVVLNNLNEYAPEIEEQTFSVNERSLTGTIIGNIVATDPDSGQSLTFKIESGNDNQVIQLDTITGELTVQDSAWFNYSINQELVCMVSVCDNDSAQPLKSYALITVEVLDVPFKTIDISGYVQKGPFILGSTITISELGNDLQPTGRIFTTQVADNSGKFELPNVELESSFLLLKADGFYFNERTGELSEAQLTLHNLVDITDLESFNINVLSHLEKDRIVELLNGGMEFKEAKLHAKIDILGIFGFVSVDQLQSDEMDIANAGEDNAMLLALSLILQGNRTTGDFSELLGQIGLDIKEDGTLGNATIGTALINGINYANLEQIRQNTEQRYNGLGIGYEIPDFEKYVNQFIQTTDFIATNQLVFPTHGSAGVNFLHPDITTISNEARGNFSVDIPKGRSLKFDVLHNSLWISTFSGVNMVWSKYEINEDGVGHNLFEATSTGLCEVNVNFRCDGQSNIVKINFYEDGDIDPTYFKIIQIRDCNVPIDSTLLR